MAKKRPTSKVIQSSTQQRKDAESAFKADALRRLEDADQILSAADLSGQYDLLRTLFTTVDGTPRAVTSQDIANFKAEVNRLRKRHSAKGRFRGGIRVDQVIDLALSVDRDRARRQIRTAIPVSNRAGVIHFTTNASAGSSDSRHHVYVEFMDFSAWAATPDAPNRVAQKLIKSSPIKYDCDCGRHTFWYRYIASVGGFAYGRLEDGYPKIRNPKLNGVACKHVLRVMAQMKSPTMKAYIAKMVERSRDQLQPRRKGNTPKEQEEFLKAIRKESSRYKSIAQSPKARKAALNKRKTPEGKVIQKAIDKSMEKVSKNAAKNGKDKAIKQELRKLERNLKRAGLLTEGELRTVLAQREAALREEL